MIFNKKDFPLLAKKINEKNIIYLDSAATSQKPLSVIEAVSDFYKNYNAPVHRAVYDLGEDATMLYEQARKKIADFIQAKPHEIIFTKSATESINFVAQTWALAHVAEGDEIVLTELEHHANLIPWQQLALKKKAHIKYIPVREDGTLNLDDLSSFITGKTKLVAITHISNALGTVNDVEKITQYAHKVGARVLVDAAQSAPHLQVNVQKIGCDFLVFSGHKMLGPTGIGVLYIADHMQEQTPPYQFGGGMVFEAGFGHSSFLKSPQKYEAGTPPIAQAVGLAAAVDYITKTAPNEQLLQAYEASLCRRLIEGLQSIPGVKILGPIEDLKKNGHMVAFTLADIHSHDAATFLGIQGICVRAGHHCAQPLATRLGISSSLRVSFYGYNTLEDVNFLLQGVQNLIS